MTSLSVVMPVHNEGKHLVGTIEALVEAVDVSGFQSELVLVDDGSTDGTAEIVRESLRGHMPLRIISQPNRGRFEARRAGLQAASAEWVLLLDGRVRLAHGALAYVHTQITGSARVWNGHIYVTVDRNPFGAFWNVLAELAWREYFDHPRTTSFDSESFDHYPKGTGCFLAPRQLLLEAVGAFRSYYSDSRFVSDDTAVIRWLAKRERIYVSPEFGGQYSPRTDLISFLRQALYRGSTFIDGHGRRESRFFPVAVGFFPVSLGLTIAAFRRPVLIPTLAAASGITAGATAARARRSRFETLSVTLLAPLYAVAHGLGMWRGMLMLLRSRLGHQAPYDAPAPAIPAAQREESLNVAPVYEPRPKLARSAGVSRPAPARVPQRSPYPVLGFVRREARFIIPPVAGIATFAAIAALVEAFTDRDWSLSGLEWPADFLTAVVLVCLVPLTLVLVRMLIQPRRTNSVAPDADRR